MLAPSPLERLLVLLLPSRLEDFALRVPTERLLAAPGVIAVEPPRVSYRAITRLPPGLSDHVARRQAKRMRLPGELRAVAIFSLLQLDLAAALIEHHGEVELWQLGGDDELRAAFALDLATATDLRPAWERMEAIGVESGRLGSERVR